MVPLGSKGTHEWAQGNPLRGQATPLEFLHCLLCLVVSRFKLWQCVLRWWLWTHWLRTSEGCWAFVWASHSSASWRSFSFFSLLPVWPSENEIQFKCNYKHRIHPKYGFHTHSIHPSHLQGNIFNVVDVLFSSPLRHNQFAEGGGGNLFRFYSTSQPSSSHAFFLFLYCADSKSLISDSKPNRTFRYSGFFLQNLLGKASKKNL